MKIPIQMRAEFDALVGDLPQAAEAENLEPAGVGQNGVRPRHEAVQAAHAADQFMAGANEQVVGIGEQNLDAEFSGEVAFGQALDCGLRPDRHENRRSDGPVRGVEQARPRPGARALGHHFEEDLAQVSIVCES